MVKIITTGSRVKAASKALQTERLDIDIHILAWSKVQFDDGKRHKDSLIAVYRKPEKAVIDKGDLEDLKALGWDFTSVSITEGGDLYSAYRWGK